MKLIVNKQQRIAKMRAHTVTHILHAELNAIFPHTKQAGSLVDEDYTRFDFQAKEALSNEQIEQIENNINKIIYQSQEISCEELAYNEAIQKWAKAFFGDKYGDRVRMVTIAQTASIELCGGTHVKNTADIGACKIISQEAVAAGVKRIIAVTWPKVVEYYQKQAKTLQNFAAKLNVPLAQLEKKFDKTIKENKEMKESIESLQSKLLSTELQTLATKKERIAPFDIIIEIPKTLLELWFKNITIQTKQLFSHKNTLLRTETGQYAIIANNWLNAKERAKNQGIRWGGNETTFQWKDEKIREIV